MSVFKESFREFAHSKMAIAAFIAIPLLIGFFSMFYVSSFLDPVEQMKQLHVAVVNQDGGTTVDGEQVNYGDDMVSAILENDAVVWEECSPELLDEGLENTDYYMALIISKDFSSQIAAGQEGDAEVANLTFWRNERKNYVLSLLSSRINAQLETMVQQMVSTQYARALETGLQTAADGYGDAATGAASIEDGAATLTDGLGSAVSGTSSLQTGVDTLSQGASTASQGAQQLSSGTASLQSATEQLPDKTAQLSSGVTSAAKGMQTAANAASSMESASSSVTSGLTSLSQGLSAGASSLGELSVKLGQASESIGDSTTSGTLRAGASSAASCIQAASAAEAAGGAYGGKTTQEWLALAASAVDGVDGGLATLQTGISSASDGVAAAEGTLTEASNSIGSPDEPGQTLAYASAQVTTGLSSLGMQLSASQSSMEQLEEGANSLSEASETLTSSIASINQGASSLSTGNASLASGSAELASNIPALQSGLQSAAEGSTALGAGASELGGVLSDGQATISDSLPADLDSFAQYVADPVDVNDDAYGELDHYGLGFAAFFITMALWLGSLVIFFVADPFPASGVKAGRMGVVFGRFPLFLLYGLVEVLAVIAACIMVGVPMLNAGMFVLILAVTSVVFIVIMQNLNLLFGLPGKALAILIMLLQMVGGSGTMPVELSNSFMQSLSPWLPFTYSIDALREVMSGGNWATAFTDLGMLLLFGVVFLAMTLLLYPIGEKMNVKSRSVTLKKLQAS